MSLPPAYQRCEELRNVDRLLDYYTQQRNCIIDYLSKYPEVLVRDLWGKYLDLDRSCKYRMGHNPHTSQSCTNCTCLSRLTDDLNQREIIIESGTQSGLTLEIVTRPGNKNQLEVSSSLVQDIGQVVIDNPLLMTCGTHSVDELTFLRTDPVTTEILTTYLCNLIDRRSAQLITAYQCDNLVYLVKEKSIPLISLTTYSVQLASSLTLQVIASLQQLSKYNFTHGNPDPSHITLIDQAISKTVDGVHLNSPYKLGLELGGYSSLTVGRTRISPIVNQAQVSTKPRLIKTWNSQVTIYTIEANKFQGFKYSRRAGTPLYPGSFDVYCFLVGLMVNQSFRSAIEELLAEVWHLLWIGHGDLELLNQRLDRYQGYDFPSYDDIVTKLLSGLWLRCDALDIIWANCREQASDNLVQ